MGLKYFAYGSNMSPKIISEVCAKIEALGPARLEDHRLAFTRTSIKTRSGVADIVPVEGMSVWGVVFVIDENALLLLDRKEGGGKAYRRIEVEVVLPDYSRHRAVTYTVIDKEPREVSPNSAYLQSILEGAIHWGLPEDYIEFLRSLGTENPDLFRDGLLVAQTFDRSGAEGSSLVGLAESAAKKLCLGPQAVVVHKEKASLVKVGTTASQEEQICRLDQAVRHALGIPGRQCYGACVTVHPVRGRMWPFPFVRARSIVVPIHRPSWLDSEKNLCVLHDRNIRVLGLRQGDYVRIQVPFLGDDGKYQAKSISLRVFAGTAATIPRSDGKISYPQPDELYLDFHGRRQLGVARNTLATPAKVTADVWKLFASRFLYYGITLLLSMVALSPVVEELLPRYMKPLGGLGVTLGLSVLATLILCVFDIRGRVQY